jgi:hypothetical protein
MSGAILICDFPSVRISIDQLIRIVSVAYCSTPGALAMVDCPPPPKQHALAALDAVLGPGHLIAVGLVHHSKAHPVKHQKIVLSRLH